MSQTSEVKRARTFGGFGLGLMVVGIVAAWLLGSTQPAAAQQDETPEAKVDIEAFRSHVARGAELREQEEYRQALAHFEKARAIADHPKLMLATGNIREAIGDCSGAREDMRRALDDGRASTKLGKKIVVALEENRQCVDRGVIIVACKPDVAEVRIDDRLVSCGDEAELPSGWHSLTARATEYRSSREQVSIAPGGLHHHEVELVEIDTQDKRRRDADTVPAWMSYGAYGSIGGGAVLLMAGLVSDASATGRQDELQRAHLSGDVTRANRLVQEAHSAQTHTALLYSGGVVLAATGGLLWAYDEEIAGWFEVSDDVSDDATVRAQVRVGGGGATVGATLVW